MIHVDWNYTRADRVGPEHGLEEGELRAAIDAAAPHAAALRDEHAEGGLAFLDLSDKAVAAKEVATFAQARRGRHPDVIVAGIGGSALGAKTLLEALPAASESPRFHFVDNADPDIILTLREEVDFSKALLLVVTKSGGTPETLAALLALLPDFQAYDDWRERVVAVTDPEKGFLRGLARKEGLPSFPIPPGVGGRFSVLTPVGLLPAALAGIPIQNLLDGARDSAHTLLEAAPAENPALVSAVLHHVLATRRGKTIAVFMPYASRLRRLSDWFAQLWAESIGKAVTVDGEPTAAGTTPLPALGATDQHSLVQLFMEGPNDKFLTFVVPRSFQGPVHLPDLFPQEPTLAALGGRDMADLLHAEVRGAAAALARSGRPSMTLTIPRIGPAELGALLVLLEVQTVFGGRLWNVNPFDQPGVEAGKQNAAALMGRPDLAEHREGLEAWTRTDKDSWTLTLSPGGSP